MRFIILLSLMLSLAEAIISVAPVKLGEKTGYSGSVDGSLETKRGNTETDSYMAGVKLQYDEKKEYAVYVNLTGSYGKASGQTNTNKTYLHARVVHALYEELAYEYYVQSETNEFVSINRRLLTGGGLRYNFKNHDYGEFYAGLGVYGEMISYTTQIDPFEKNFRVNSYIAYVKDFTKTARFAYIGYFQPKIDDLGDYITSNAIELKLHVYEKLYLKFNLYYDIDTKPAIGRKTTDFSQLTSFSYSF